MTPQPHPTNSLRPFQALVLCAGLGTRLKPWTLHHPKALVPVGGIPMLQRVAENLHARGCKRLIVNVHHFADQIEEFIASHGHNVSDNGKMPLDANAFGMQTVISDERSLLLDTGGAVLKADSLADQNAPLLVHNVDILSSAPLETLIEAHLRSDDDITLMVSSRPSTRRLVFDPELRLRGWHDCRADNQRPSGASRYRPHGLVTETDWQELAFSGIYVISPNARKRMAVLYDQATPFSIMDFFLRPDHGLKISGVILESPDLIDIGKPESLERAGQRFNCSCDASN